MKYLYFLLFYLSIVSETFTQPGVLSVLDPKGNELTSDSKIDCVDVTYSITKNGVPVDAVNKDCPENFEFSIIVSYNCPQVHGLIPVRCEYNIKIMLNGQVLHTSNNIDLTNSINYSGDFSELPNISELGCPFKHKFIVVTEKVCTFPFDLPNHNSRLTGVTSVPFTLVSTTNNHSYVVSEKTNELRLGDQVYCIDEINGEAISGLCCNSGGKWVVSFESLFRNDFSISNGVTGTLSATVSSGISTSVMGVTLFNTEVSAEVSSTISQSTSELIRKDFSLSRTYVLDAKEGECVFPGYRLNYQVFLEKTYESNCNGPDVLLDVREVLIPFDIIPYNGCSIIHDNCDPLLPPIWSSGGNKSFANCTGFISGDYGSVDLSTLSMNWTGPDGFQSSEFNLTDLPSGIYSYTLSNECCDEINGTVELCPNKEVGPWVLQNDNITYCQDVFCSESDSGKRQEVPCSSVTNICVEPDQIDSQFDGIDCIENHFYQGEYLGSTVLGNPIEEIEYDELTQQCTKITFCSSQEVARINALPNYGPWSFNIVDEKCERLIICFGEFLNQVEQRDATIVDVYNNFSGLCERTAYCEGTPYFLPPVFPLINGPWQWSEFEGCTKDVQCSFNSEVLSVVGTESFSNWSFNSSSNMCLANAVACDGTLVPGAVHSESPNHIGDWSWTSAAPFDQQCFREIYCGASNSQVTDYTFPVFVESGIPCSNSGNATASYIFCNGVNVGLTCETSPGPLAYGKSEKPSFRVYPNPFTEKIYLSQLSSEQNLKIEIVDRDGKLVFSASEFDSSLELEHLNTGMYHLLILKEGQLMYHERIVKF